jgi:hypothetical protein
MLVCFLSFAREAAGASCTRLSLRPLFSRVRKSWQTSGAMRGENAKVCHHCRPGQAKRDPGPITTNVRVVRSWSHSVVYDKHRWLWVPAFAGTTKGCLTFELGKPRKPRRHRRQGVRAAARPFKPAENPCGTRPSGGRGRGSARRRPSSARNCRRPCRGGRSASETAWCWPPPFSPRDR